jgi:FkbM family methyltransferase
VFELGAHQGLLALAAARVVAERGEVLAVEAQPHNARVAERNCELNGIENVSVLNAAVMDRPGTVRVAVELNSRPLPGARGGTVAVPAVTIDGLAADYGEPDVVLLDVEGFECHALEGARRLISRRSSTFMIEVHANRGLEDAGGSIEALASHFSEGGYDLVAAKARDQHAIDDWAPFEAWMPIFDRRFFLMATPTRTGRTTVAEPADRYATTRPAHLL